MQNERIVGYCAKTQEGHESQAIQGIVGFLEKRVSEDMGSNKAQRVRHALQWRVQDVGTPGP